MNTKYSIKNKVGRKYFTFGNVQPGEKGPRMGLRVSPELRQMIAAVEDGKWVNFLLFPSDDAPRQSQSASQQDYPPAHVLADETIPF